MREVNEAILEEVLNKYFPSDSPLQSMETEILLRVRTTDGTESDQWVSIRALAELMTTISAVAVSTEKDV